MIDPRRNARLRVGCIVSMARGRKRSHTWRWYGRVLAIDLSRAKAMVRWEDPARVTWADIEQLWGWS